MRKKFYQIAVPAAALLMAATQAMADNHTVFNQTPCRTAEADGAAAPGGAEAVDTSRVYDLDEVVVVSQPKEVLALRRQPLSSTVLAGRDIDVPGSRGLQDLAAYVPSLVMPAYGSRLTSSVYVRGIGSRVNNPAVGVYVDGIPLVSKNSYNFHVYQTERIDVLRGPQGTLYGMNTEGGIVRLYTKNPFTHRGTDIRLGIGTGLTREAEAAHYGRAGDGAAYMIGAFYSGQNGFFTNATTGRRADAADEAGAKARLSLRPTARLSVDVTADYQYTRQAAFAYGLLDTQTRAIADPANNRDNTYRRNMLNTGLGLTYRTDGLTLGSQTSYQLLDDCMRMDQDYLPTDYMHLEQRQLMNAVTQELTLKSDQGGRWRHTTGVYGSYQWLRTDAPVYFDDGFTQPIASAISSSIYQSILQAMTATGMPQAAAEAVISQAGGVSATARMDVPATFRTPQANIGVYHESNLRLASRLTATLGLRYDYSRVSVSYDTGAKMTVAATVMGATAEQAVRSALDGGTHSSYSQLLPKIGLSLDIDNDGSTVYATVSKGYRAGGYNIQMFSDILQAELTASRPSIGMPGAGGTTGGGNGQDGQTTDIEHTADDYERINRTISYKPEVSWNYEIGSHLNLFGGMVHADLAAYCMLIRNQQLSVMAEGYGFGRMMVNAGRSRSLGVEAAVRGRAWDNRLSWAATYAFTSAEFTRYTDAAATAGGDGTAATAVDYAGKSVPYVPRHTLSARADLRLPLGRTGAAALLFGADVTAQGRTYWDEANTVSQPFYALLGLHAGVQTGLMEVRLWCRNLTDTSYATFAFSSSATGSERWFAQKGNPIQAGVDLRLSL